MDLHHKDLLKKLETEGRLAASADTSQKDREKLRSDLDSLTRQMAAMKEEHANAQAPAATASVLDFGQQIRSLDTKVQTLQVMVDPHFVHTFSP